MLNELFLSVDVGGSQTKVVYQKSSDPSQKLPAHATRS